jgi:hypothetical protein
MLHVSEDPDKAWAELGQYFMYEAATYRSWQTDDISSAVHSHASTPEELRAEVASHGARMAAMYGGALDRDQASSP